MVGKVQTIITIAAALLLADSSVHANVRSNPARLQETKVALNSQTPQFQDCSDAFNQAVMAIEPVFEALGRRHEPDDQWGKANALLHDASEFLSVNQGCHRQSQILAARLRARERDEVDRPNSPHDLRQPIEDAQLDQYAGHYGACNHYELQFGCANTTMAAWVYCLCR